MQSAYRRSTILGTVLLLVAIALCLNVWIANGNPLFYFDTVGYFAQGNAALNQIMPAGADGGALPPQGLATDDNRVIGSRSLAYSVVLALASRTGTVGYVPALQLAIVILALWLAVRVVLRASDSAVPTTLVLAAVVLAGCATSMPFYVAYLMPDFLTPVLLLAVATLIAGAGHMKTWETVALVLLGLLATLSHASHIPIAGLLALFVLIAGLFRSGTRRKAGLTILSLVVLLFAVGIGERLLFGYAVNTSNRGQVVYQPYATARLIADGPGLQWLAENCPENGAESTEVATCALYPLLKESPPRRHPVRIIFDRSEQFGSFARLDRDMQTAIAREQVWFATQVVLAHPVATARKVAGNVFEQLHRNRAAMTVMNQGVMRKAGPAMEYYHDGISERGLRPTYQWNTTLGHVHEVIYLVSLIGIIVLLLPLRNRVPAPARSFAWMILIGILANAIVCGAGSIPADRYGARVAFLLPCVFVLLLFLASAPAHRRRGTRPGT